MVINVVSVYVYDDIEDENAENENEKTLLTPTGLARNGDGPSSSFTWVAVKRSSVPRYPSFPYHPWENRYTAASRI